MRKLPSAVDPKSEAFAVNARVNRALVEDLMTGEGRRALDEKGYFLPPPDATP